jgi:uncharacterized phiE125 gp8 family phage protein
MGLIELADAKAFLKVDYADEDTLIQSLIDEATAVIQKDYGRDIVQTTYTDEEYNGEGHELLFIENWPVQSVSELKIDDEVIDVANYSLSKRTGVLKYQGRIPEGFGNVKVSYVGGYAATDPDLPFFQNKCRLLVSDLYEGRGA